MEKLNKIWLNGIMLAILIGSGLRLYNLDQRGLWNDELYSVGLASLVGKDNNAFLPIIKHPGLLTIEDNFWTWKLTDPTPPLYDVLLTGWVKIAGTSDFAVRFPSAIFGIVLLIYSYLGLRKVLPLETLFYYIVWLSLSLVLIRYSQEARSYSLTVLLAGILTVEFARHFFRNSQNHFAPIAWQFIFILLMLSYSHFYGLLLAGVFTLWVSINVLWYRQYRELIKFIVLIIGIVPLLIFAIHVKRYLVTLQPLDTMLNFDKVFFISLSQSFENVLPYFGFVGLLIVVIGLFYIIKYRTESTTVNLGLTLLAITLLFTLFMAIGMRNKGAWLDRYFISIVPVLILSLAIFISEIRIQRIVKTFILMSLLIFPLYKTMGNNYQIDDQYREASKFIGQKITDKDVLLMTYKPNLMIYLHYLQRFGRTETDKRTMIFNENDITSTNCQYIKNQLYIDSKLFIFHHSVHENYIKKLFEVCQFSKDRIIKNKFNYLNVAIYQESKFKVNEK